MLYLNPNRHTPYLIVATTILAALAPPVSADSTATVKLRVAPEGFVVPSHWLLGNPAVWLVDPEQTPTFNGLPGVAGCWVTATDADGNARITGGEVLDAATAGGCISGWAGQAFPGGTFVTMVDGVEQLGGGLVAWWLLQVNEWASPVGIDDLDLHDGDRVDFVYYVGPL